MGNRLLPVSRRTVLFVAVCVCRECVSHPQGRRYYSVFLRSEFCEE